MVRLGPRDFGDAAWVTALARAAGLGEDDFRARFDRFARATPEGFFGRIDATRPGYHPCAPTSARPSL